MAQNRCMLIQIMLLRDDQERGQETPEGEAAAGEDSNKAIKHALVLAPYFAAEKMELLLHFMCYGRTGAGGAGCGVG